MRRHFKGWKAKGCGCVFSLSVGLSWQPTGSPLPVCGWWQSSEPPNSWKLRSERAARCSDCTESFAVGGSVTLVCQKQCEIRLVQNSIRKGHSQISDEKWFSKLEVASACQQKLCLGKRQEVSVGGSGRERALEMRIRGREQAKGREGSSQEVSQIV